MIRPIIFSSLLLLPLPGLAVTDSLKWPIGHEPVGQSNGPDTLDDVWQALYNGWGLAPAGDEDSDGCSNYVEAVAGTNPRVSGDCLRVGNTILSGNQILFSFQAEGGKKYRILSDTSPGGAFTTIVPQTLPVNGATQFIPGADVGTQVISITKGVGDDRKFFRLEASDVDTDSDGVSDWAEISTGLNPALADSDGNGTNDGDEITAAVSVPDTVSISATESGASEDGPESGAFTISRSRALFPLDVDLTFAGTAAAPADYSTDTGGNLSFAVGESSKVIHVNPIADAVVEGQESVTATIVSAEATTNDDFGDPQIGTASATVVIGNSTTIAGTGLTARFYDHASTTADSALNFGDTASYNFTRGSPTTQGTIVVTPTSGVLATLLAAITPGTTQVKLSFTSGNLNNAPYNHLMYPVTAKSSSTFTVSITAAAALPTSGTGNGAFSIQPIHPPRAERTETVNHDLAFGTPNDVGMTPVTVIDNYSTLYEGWLHPTTAGSYRFQLDGDDRARLLLDLNLNGVFELPGEQVVEHGWDSSSTASPEDGIADNETIGTFKVQTMAGFTLAVPASAAQRYKIRLEHVETTGSARCRFQWSRDNGTFGNPGSTNLFSHTTQATYASSGGTITVTTPAAHGLTAGVSTADLWFNGGTLVGTATNYAGAYAVLTTPTSTTFTVSIGGAPTQAAGSNVLWGNSLSTTAGMIQTVYASTSFAGGPGHVSIQGAGPNQNNNGIFGAGSPDPLIAKDTFSAHWSGQVQPQFSEEYTFVVHADNGATVRFNGQVQEMEVNTSTSQSGATYSHDSSTGITVVTYSGMVVKPDSFVVGETIRLNPTGGALNYSSGATYTYTPGSGETVVDFAAMSPATFLANAFQVGQTVFLDPTSNRLNSLSSLPYTITAVTATSFTVNVGANLFPADTSALTGTINILDTLDLVITAATSSSFTVNHGALRHPSVAAGATAEIEIINKPLRDWSSMGNQRYFRATVLGGQRYDIQLDCYDDTGYARAQLFWFSPSQPMQIIPAERLYPQTGPLAPAVHANNVATTALIGGPFTYTIAGTNGGTISVSGLPAWLTYSNGVISGTPPAGSAGTHQILVTLTNANGTSQSVVDLEVQEAGGSVTREVWTGIAGSSIASIPVGNAPSLTTSLTSLDLPNNAGDDYGSRVRGYITAPTTGNYYFWINSPDTAEFWLSNDQEVVNNFKRAAVTAGSQRSPWMAMEQGKRYYFEILHKAATGTADDVSLSWSKPGESTASATEVVPGYAITAYTPPAPGSTPGTLYVATMLSQGGALTNGVGTATLRVNEDETVAYVSFDMDGFSTPPYRGLTGIMTDWHVHADPYLTNPSAIIYDGVEPPPGDGLQPDGTHKWTITAVGTLSADAIRELIKQGKAYINIHTAAYPNGEIRGNYTLANGSRTFSPPPPPPPWEDDSNTDAGASRFLTQASYGPNIPDITALKGLPPTSSSGLYPASRYETWIDNQLALPATESLSETLRMRRADAQGGSQLDETLFFNSWWRNSIIGADQLRQRVAFALSQIHVISGQGPLDNRGEAIAYFYDTLTSGAFGNFRNILETTTLTPAMGRYLDMRNNDKPDLTVGRIPNENYAREIKQLFSIGLYRMWPDGTLMLTSSNSPIDTYTQREIVGYAHVFTGWTDNFTGTRTSLSAPTNWLAQMMPVPARHFTGQKRILNNEVLPGLPTLGNQPLDPFASHNSTHFNQAPYVALPTQELDAAHDQLFYHPNTGPFICRQLIQRMVTSHPSRDYLYRVVQKFNDDGTGVRGNMQAVIKAVLLDYEARSPDMITKPAYGKQREPLLRVAAAGRAFRPSTYNGTYSQTGTRTITVDTSTPHKLASGNTVMLDFTAGATDVTAGIPAPWSGNYSVTVVNTTRFTINATNHATGTYSIPANSTVCTVAMSNHWLQVGNQFFMDFTSNVGTGAGQLADGVAGLDRSVYAVATNPNATSNGDNGPDFTFSIPAGQISTVVRSGNCMIPRFSPGSMQIASSGLTAPNDRRVSMRTNEDHHLKVGDQVQLNVFNTQATPQPIDVVATVDTVTDLKGYTFLISSATTGWSNSQGNNSVYQFPLLSQPLTRSGSIGSRSSTFQIGNTDGALDQSPVNADTVFNFFLPDYKFPGSLASQGVTTPEFQLTAETGVIRQANYVYDAVFNSSTTNGFSSFTTGNGALTLDYADWINGNAIDLGLGAPTSTAVPWTHNQNIAALIDRLSTLLTSNQLSSGAKTIIRDLVALPISSIAVGSPCVINTTRPHNYTTGQSVVLSGVTGGTFSTANAFTNNSTARAITVVDADTFTVTGINCTSIASINVANAHASQIAYDQNSTPATTSATQRRDRMRSILHLILTSPDFNVQR